MSALFQHKIVGNGLQPNAIYNHKRANFADISNNGTKLVFNNKFFIVVHLNSNKYQNHVLVGISESKMETEFLSCTSFSRICIMIYH